uniref:GMT n=1 Tax=Caenorhabditis tropicalis TaxID=1561998 RepID=A0A1I7UE01_9PELO
MCSHFWLQLTFLAECIGISLSSTSNFILFLMILETPRKKFGSYKYLMLSFAALGIFYSCGNFITKPNVILTKTSFAVFTELGNYGLTKGIGTIVVSCSASIYGLMLSLLCVQFYYRFIAVTSPMTLSTKFTLKTSPIYIILVFSNTATWGLVSYYLNGPTPEKDRELAPAFISLYCLAPGEYSYIGAKFFNLTETNERVYHFQPFIGTACSAFVLLATFSIAAYLGMRTYRSLKNLGTSQAHKELQNQLF